MDIRSPVNLSGGSLCAWSQNGRYLAVVTSKARLVIRDSADLQVIRSEVVIYPLSDGLECPIEKVAFSPDSEFVLAASFKTATTFVFRVLQSDWKAKISEGPSGLIDVNFSPDSRQILSLSQFNLKMTIWSLCEKRVRYIKFPKCAAFRPSSREENDLLLAVVERRGTRDSVSLFSTQKWNIERHFETNFSSGTGTGVAGISWSPKGDAICLYSSHLDFQVKVYSPLEGRCLMSFDPEDAVSYGLGLRCVEWSPCGNILLLGGGDSTIKVFNSLNWSLISDLEIPDFLIESPQVEIYEERQIDVADLDVDLRIAKEWANPGLEFEYVVVNERPVQLTPISTKERSPNKLGVSLMSFSPDGLYLCVKSDTLPSTVFIWNVVELSLMSVVVHRHPVVSCQWSPTGSRFTNKLLILTGDSSMLHCWTPKGVACMGLPAMDKDYQVNEIQWNPQGKAIALIGKSSIVCCQVGK